MSTQQIRKSVTFILLILTLLVQSAPGENKEFEQINKALASEYSSLELLYKQLHANPELSMMEKETSVRMAAELKAAGYKVTENIGPYGVVGIMKNGPGPVLMIRTDMDGLPTKEKTGLPYSSKVKMKNKAGKIVDVMHSCGHDVHMTVFIGTARVMSRLKNKWSGTLLMVAQQAEETGEGARLMIKNGLFKRFPRPQYALALHDGPFPAGMVSIGGGYITANVDSIDITIFGVGGHGAAPNYTKDPIVIAAQLITALQTIVSRELDPTKSAVVTVGSIHGGTKHNIIPDEVKLQLTVRSYGDKSRKQILTAIKRIASGVARTAGIPEKLLPDVQISERPMFSVYNDPDLTKRVTKVFRKLLGDQNVLKSTPIMGGEDFSEYGRVEPKIPICLFWLGASDPKAFFDANKKGEMIPGPHSPFWAPVIKPTIRTGVISMSAASLNLLKK